MTTPYDEIPYPGMSYPFAHPDRMAVAGRLHGLASPDPARATLLELGAGDGSNLLSLAQLWPEARCIGVDLSGHAIGLARQRAEALGLTNVELHHAPLEALLDPTGPVGPLPRADYIIAHGLVSWVPPATRQALFELVGRSLSDDGVAMLSFQTWPGYSDVEPLRALMRHHVENVADPAKKVQQARDIAVWHILRWERLFGAARTHALRALYEEIAAMPDAVFLHDLLSPEHHPLSLTEITAELAPHGVAWLTNARMNEPRTTQLPDPLRELARASDDPVRRQQYLDYFLMTRFRTSLFCRLDAVRAGRVVRNVEPQAFRPFHIAGRVSAEKLGRNPGRGLVVTTAVGDVTLSEEATRVLVALSDVMPSALPTSALVARAAPLSETDVLHAVAELWLADAIELSLAPPAVASALPDHPVASPLARLLAAEDRPTATSLWHREWSLDPDETAALIAMDGTRPGASFEPEAARKLLRKAFIMAA